ncbi:hypothetical protein AGIG_G3283 [Arapaima gigas]
MWLCGLTARIRAQQTQRSGIWQKMIKFVETSRDPRSSRCGSGRPVGLRGTEGEIAGRGPAHRVKGPRTSAQVGGNFLTTCRGPSGSIRGIESRGLPRSPTAEEEANTSFGDLIVAPEIGPFLFLTRTF